MLLTMLWGHICLKCSQSWLVSICLLCLLSRLLGWEGTRTRRSPCLWRLLLCLQVVHFDLSNVRTGDSTVWIIYQSLFLARVRNHYILFEQILSHLLVKSSVLVVDLLWLLLFKENIVGCSLKTRGSSSVICLSHYGGRLLRGICQAWILAGQLVSREEIVGRHVGIASLLFIFCASHRQLWIVRARCASKLKEIIHLLPVLLVLLLVRGSAGYCGILGVAS